MTTMARRDAGRVTEPEKNVFSLWEMQMLSKEQLKSRADQIRKYVEGNDFLNDDEIKAALENAGALEELLSLRKAKPYGYTSSMCERDLLKGHSCPLYPARDEDAGYTIPLFTTAKPVPDQRVLRDYIRSYGYTTNGQSDELAVAILALLNGEDANDDNY